MQIYNIKYIQLFNKLKRKFTRLIMTDKKEEINVKICCPIPYISECDKNTIVLLFKVTASTNEQKQNKI